MCAAPGRNHGIKDTPHDACKKLDVDEEAPGVCAAPDTLHRERRDVREMTLLDMDMAAAFLTLFAWL